MTVPNPAPAEPSATDDLSPQQEPLAGRVFWITGFSGAGKSTAALDLAARLRRQQRHVIVLDGDELRAVYGDGLAFTLTDRRILAMRHARLCRLLSSQGFDVVCATISLFHDCHRWCRQNLSHYHEIYLRVTMEELRRRDPRGLYRGVINGTQSDLVGVDLPVEEPQSPDLTIENDGRWTAADVADQLWRYVSHLEGCRGAG